MTGGGKLATSGDGLLLGALPNAKLVNFAGLLSAASGARLFTPFAFLLVLLFCRLLRKAN